jgi:hypothetical protein
MNHESKQLFPESTKLVKLLLVAGLILLGKGFFEGLGEKFGDKVATWLLEHIKSIPEWIAKLIYWVLDIAPSQKEWLKISRALYWISTPLLVIPFSYTLLKESFYVDRMYVLRDLVEAKKLKTTDLTPDQFRFIYDHWPELFKP